MELVKSRLLRATAALENAGIAYAVIGGNAVAAWVGRVDESVVRFTQDVDLLIRRTDFEATKAARSRTAGAIDNSSEPVGHCVLRSSPGRTANRVANLTQILF